MGGLAFDVVVAGGVQGFYAGVVLALHAAVMAGYIRAHISLI